MTKARGGGRQGCLGAWPKLGGAELKGSKQKYSHRGILGCGGIAMRPAAELHESEGEGWRSATASTPACAPVLDHARESAGVVLGFGKRSCIIFALVHPCTRLVTRTRYLSLIDR